MHFELVLTVRCFKQSKKALKQSLVHRTFHFFGPKPVEEKESSELVQLDYSTWSLIYFDEQRVRLSIQVSKSLSHAKYIRKTRKCLVTLNYTYLA